MMADDDVYVDVDSARLQELEEKERAYDLLLQEVVALRQEVRELRQQNAELLKQN